MSRRLPHPGTKAAFIYNRSKKSGTYPTLHGDPFHGKQVVGLSKQQVRRDLLAMGVERRRLTQLAKTKEKEIDGLAQVVHQSVVQKPQEDPPVAKTRSGTLRAKSTFKLPDTYKHLQIYTGDRDWVLYDANIPFTNLADAEVPDAIKRFARYESGNLRVLIYNRSTKTFKLIRENGILHGTPIIYTDDGPRQGKAPRPKGVNNRTDQKPAARSESNMIASQPAKANHALTYESVASKASVAKANIRPTTGQPSTTDHATSTPAASTAKTARSTRSRIYTCIGEKNAEDNPVKASTAANTRKRKATAIDDRDEETKLSESEPVESSTETKRLKPLFDQRQPDSTVKPAKSSEQKPTESKSSKSMDQASSLAEPRVPKQGAATGNISKKPALDDAATQQDKTKSAEAKARLRAYLSVDSSVSKLIQRGQGGTDTTSKSLTRTNNELRQQPTTTFKQRSEDARDTPSNRKLKREEVSDDNTAGDQKSDAGPKRAKSCQTGGSTDI